VVKCENADDDAERTSCSVQEELAFMPAHCNASFNRLKHRNVQGTRNAARNVAHYTLFATNRQTQ